MGSPLDPVTTSALVIAGPVSEAISQDKYNNQSPNMWHKTDVSASALMTRSLSRIAKLVVLLGCVRRSIPSVNSGVAQRNKISVIFRTQVSTPQTLHHIQSSRQMMVMLFLGTASNSAYGSTSGPFPSEDLHEQLDRKIDFKVSPSIAMYYNPRSETRSELIKSACICMEARKVSQPILRLICEITPLPHSTPSFAAQVLHNACRQIPTAFFHNRSIHRPTRPKSRSFNSGT